MTHVPGFIPKPNLIVIFLGTFVIICQKVAVDFFRIMIHDNIFDERFLHFFFDVEK